MLKVSQLIKVLEMERVFGERRPCHSIDPVGYRPRPAPRPQRTIDYDAEVSFRLVCRPDPDTGEPLYWTFGVTYTDPITRWVKDGDTYRREVFTAQDVRQAYSRQNR